jgi:hypothetical protein
MCGEMDEYHMRVSSLNYVRKQSSSWEDYSRSVGQENPRTFMKLGCLLRLSVVPIMDQMDHIHTLITSYSIGYLKNVALVV